MFLLGNLVAIVQIVCMSYIPEEANSAFNGIRGDVQNNVHFKADTPPRDNHINISTRNRLTKFNKEESASQPIQASL